MQHWQITGSGTFVTQWGYNSADLQASMVYPGGNGGQAGERRYALTSLPTDRRYTGQVEEATIGLHFFNARWYDSYLP